MNTYRGHVLGALLFLGGSLLLAGCWSVQSAIDSGMSAAGEAAGERVGTAIGERLAATVNLPAAGTAQWNRFMAAQAQVFFSYAMTAGGYWPGSVTYASGEWTRFELEGQEGEGVQYRFERAYLGDSEANQWWRVSAEYDEGSWVYEALVDTSAGRLVRLRARDPEGNVGEIPVTEETVYPSRQELTEESIEGATTGTVDISVPAGTFTAQRVEYQGMGTGTITWWLSEDVPGGVVQYQVSDDGEEVWTSRLVEYGGDATTVLDSF